MQTLWFFGQGVLPTPEDSCLEAPDVKQLEIRDGALQCIEGLYIVSLAQSNKVPTLPEEALAAEPA